ncbi:DUF4384 domain-containing protein [Pseudomaricurvus sp. HS19]|uniref:DUF4384 domain-containing protein n=1 Tax=Pseudomaricurvus sp. HS19 TaxID=2692626 RepID=UPI001367E6D9|nr:DUF4384 domain-containing protein [Pseudomaricurvus sp. HS19]MYM62682.1 DUF4384 domain-containing protein [Pseudomaricurvus sp. HS19]
MATSFVAVAGCAGVAPILTTAAVNFAQNLIDAASQNAGNKYGSEIEQLVRALAYNALAQSETKVRPYFPEFGSYAGFNAQDAGAEYSGDEEAIRSVEAAGNVALDVALLAQQKQPDGSVQLMPIEDGATLYDGRGDRLAGDKIKVGFKSNCDCYVYVIGIDATGYVAQIFPDPDAPHMGNPVVAEQTYMLPEGNEWWGLDEYQGVETIYFVASPRQRTDIEMAVASMVSAPRSVTPGNYRPVTQAAVIPQPRGLVKVQEAAPLEVTSTTGQRQMVEPTAFLASAAGADLIITRWFNHQ